MALKNAVQQRKRSRSGQCGIKMEAIALIGGVGVNPHPVKGAGRQQKHAVRLQGIGLALHQIADIAADIEIDFVFCVAVQGKVRCGLAADGMVKKDVRGFQVMMVIHSGSLSFI